ncbi:OsmC family protein [Palleronia sp. KMU-117]|uniref:OsmC family protein n=1 Tax=Palleronia sp. KMU-117 TaxID=3434108 RepID=UPI003D721303
MTDLSLEELGLPLIHAVDGLADAGLAPPPDRHGQSVRAWVRTLGGIQKEGVTLSGLTGRAWRFASDEGAHLGGHDAAPNPLSYVSVGMGAFFMTELRALAKARGIALRNPVLVLENFYYRDGSFPKGTMVSGALSPEVSLTCEGDADPEDLHRLLMDAVAAAPVNGLVRDEKISLFTLTHNGVQIDPVEVAALSVPAYADPGDPIGALRPAPGALVASPLAERTESEDEVVRRITANPPLAPVLDGTKKLLHLRTTCRVRPDGTYDCLREQFAQSSSTWTFVVDDRPDHARAIAPDAASYFAIGVAFCFMTQVGRYSHMAKHPVTGYRVVQDLHFTLGGASSGSGKGGTADPAETHVFIDTDVDDDTARRIVGVAERTCFLHALCRDRAKVRIRREAIAG